MTNLKSWTPYSNDSVALSSTGDRVSCPNMKASRWKDQTTEKMKFLIKISRQQLRLTQNFESGWVRQRNSASIGSLMFKRQEKIK